MNYLTTASHGTQRSASAASRRHHHHRRRRRRRRRIRAAIDNRLSKDRNKLVDHVLIDEAPIAFQQRPTSDDSQAHRGWAGEPVRDASQ